MVTLEELSIKIEANTKEIHKLQEAVSKSSKQIKQDLENAGHAGGRALGGLRGQFAALENRMKGTIRIGGLLTGVFAGLTTVGIANFFKNAIDLSAKQQTIFASLAQSLENVGVKYADVEKTLSQKFLETQKKTIFSDEQQAEALTLLVALTGKYDKAMKALGPTLDLAATLHIDAASATRLVAQALEGNVRALGRGIPAFRQISEEQFRTLSESERLAVVLGVLESSFGGTAEAMKNTFGPSLKGVSNAWVDLKEAIGDYITTQPLLISLFKTMEERLLGQAEALSKSRKETDGANKAVSDFIDNLERAAKALKIALDVALLFGKGIRVTFNLAQTIVAGFELGVLKALEGLTKLARGTINLLPESLRPQGILETLDEHTKRIEKLNNLKLGEVTNEFNEFLDSVSATQEAINNLGDTSTIDKFFDDVREGAKGIKTNLGDITVAAKELSPEVEKLLAGIGRGSGEANRKLGQLNDSLRKQIETLQVQVATFGLSAKESLKVEAALLRQKGFAEDLIEQYVQLKTTLIELTEAQKRNAEEEKRLAALQKEHSDTVKKLAEDFEALKFASLPESEQLRQELNKQLQLISDFEKEHQDRIAEAEEVKARITAEGEKKITEAMQKEEIERLKNSDKFFDQIKGSFLELTFTAQTSFESISQFAADTFSKIRDIMAGTIERALKGNIKSLKDFWKATLDDMLAIFSQFVAAIATKKIFMSIVPNFLGSLGFLGSQGRVNPPVDRPGGSSLAGLGFAASIFGQTGFGANFIQGFTNPLAVSSSTGLAGTLGQIAGLGAPVIGMALGALFDGMEGAIQGGLAGAGVLVGNIIAPGIGGLIGGFIGNLIGGLIGSFFKKKPKLKINIPAGLQISDILADTFGDLIEKESSRLGLGEEGNAKLKKQIMDAFRKSIAQIRGIIAQLPEDVFRELSQELNEATLAHDVGFKVSGGKKEIQKKLAEFLAGGNIGDIVAGLGDFFTNVFIKTGVGVEKAKAFVEAKLEEFANLDNEAARAQFGQEFLAQVQAFVLASNIVTGHVNDAFSQMNTAALQLATTLGFEGIPSLDQLRAKLKELIANMDDLTPEVVAQYKQLRDLLISIPLQLSAKIRDLISQIQSINTSLIALGGPGVDIIPFLQQQVAMLQAFIQQNAGALSPSEMEAALGELAQAAQALQAAALQKAQAEAQAKIDAERARIEAQIAQKQKLIQLENEAYQTALDALRKQLDIARKYKAVSEQLLATLDRLIISPASPLTGIEQLNALQNEIAELEAKLRTTTDADERIEIINRLRELSAELFGVAGEVFGAGSAEQIAIFTQVTERLQELLDETKAKGDQEADIQKRIEELNKAHNEKLDRLNKEIDSLNNQLSNLGQQQVKLQGEIAAQLKTTFEFLQGEYLKLLQEKLEQLKNATSLVGTIDEQMLTVHKTSANLLASINDRLAKIIELAGGQVPASTKIFASGGVINEPVVGRGLITGSKFILGEAGPEKVIPLRRNTSNGTSDKVELVLRIQDEGGLLNSDGRERILEMLAAILEKGEGRKFVKIVKDKVYRGMRRTA